MLYCGRVGRTVRYVCLFKGVIPGRGTSSEDTLKLDPEEIPVVSCNVIIKLLLSASILCGRLDPYSRGVSLATVCLGPDSTLYYLQRGGNVSNKQHCKSGVYCCFTDQYSYYLYSWSELPPLVRSRDLDAGGGDKGYICFLLY